MSKSQPTLFPRIPRLLVALSLAGALFLSAPPAPAQVGGKIQKQEEPKATDEAPRAGAKVTQTKGTDARGSQTPAPERAGAAERPQAGQAKAKQAAKQMFAVERTHRIRAARMDRLIEIFRAKGEPAKVQELVEMKQREETRYEKAMARHEGQLEQRHARQVLAVLGRKPGQTAVENAQRKASQAGEKIERRSEKAGEKPGRAEKGGGQPAGKGGGKKKAGQQEGGEAGGKKKAGGGQAKAEKKTGQPEKPR